MDHDELNDAIAGEPIAIVGMAGRFPMADDLTTFWRNLASGKNAIREIPPERWDVTQYYSQHHAAPNKSISKWGGLIDNITLFDAQFFTISPREALTMDPQQRLLLEETWHCIEHSGIALKLLQDSKTAVFAGVMATDYRELVQKQAETDSYATTGNYDGMLANKLSYMFNLTGESKTIDTACASSLVAIHDACRVLRSGEADYALVGAASLNISPWKYISFSKCRMLSPDGQCKTFDKDANGYVPGDGVGVLLLQPLSTAIADNNRIYGLIRGSAVNHGGRTMSLTAPSVEAQADVITDALHNADITPDTVTYIEAHGTGTSLGDPIEVEGLTRAFRRFTGKTGYCHIGSVKTNIGHLEAAAGLAGVIKVLLMMRHGKIPPSLNIKTINPMIEFDYTPFTVVRSLKDWDTPDNIPRRAGVSSFGFGGVNAHIILEEPPTDTFVPDSGGKKPDIVTFSAKSARSLTRMLEQWREFAKTDAFKQAELPDLCATLRQNNSDFPYRAGAYVNNKKELADWISAAASRNGEETKEALPGQEFHLCIGNGHIPLHAIKSFYRDNALFRHYMDRCEFVMTAICGENILEEAFSRPAEGPEPRQTLLRFCASYAMVQMMGDLGITPTSISGHGAGEWVALVTSHMISLKDALACLLGHASPVEMAISRPVCPYYDLRSLKKIPPFKADAAYIADLARHIGNPIDRKSTDRFIERARLLMESQFTFRKYMEEWNPALSRFNYDIYQFLNDEHLMTGPDHSDELNRHRYLLLMIIFTSFKKLNRKWQLDDHLVVRRPRFYETLDLIMDDVLTPTDVMELVYGHNEKGYARLAEHINTRWRQLEGNKLYQYLHRHNAPVNEISDRVRWMKEIGQEVQFLPHPSWHPVFDGERVIPETEFKRKLLEFWLEGRQVKWELYNSFRSFQKTELPAYPFDRKVFWINAGENAREADREMNSTGFREAEKPVAPLPQVNDSSPSELPVTPLTIRDCTPPLPAFTLSPSGKIQLPELTTRSGPLSGSPLSERTLHQPEGYHHSPQAERRHIMDTDILSVITTVLAKELYLEKTGIQPHRPFSDMGVDSVTTVEIVNRLNRELDLNLRATVLYDYPTPDKLARYLADTAPSATSENKENAAAPLTEQTEKTPEWQKRILSKTAPTAHGQTMKETMLLNSLGESAGGGHSDGHAAVAVTQQEQEAPAAEETAKKTGLEHVIRRIVAEKLLLDGNAIPANRALRELGVDSVLTIEIVAALSHALHLELRATDLYDYPTIGKLAAHLASLSGIMPRIPLPPVVPGNGHGKQEEIVLRKPVTVPHSPVPEPTAAGASGKPEAVTDIAIIGMAGRFPGADNTDAFWQLIREGKTAFREVPASRWNSADWFDPDIAKPNKTNSKWGAFLEDIDKFDPLFFNMSPSEAETMDPQQRLCLEEAYHALEDAGYAPDRLDNRAMGVFVGVRPGDYNELLDFNAIRRAYEFIGNDNAILAARLAYFLNLKGPAIALDTACSSSLVAVHEAVKALRQGEADMALAGGVHMGVTPRLFLQTGSAGMLSPRGQCSSFDHKADGIVIGEGVGFILLKPLRNALADGDHIYAVIKGSGVNQDGSTSGITAPSAVSQTALETQVYRRWEIDPETIGLLETHGTGTKLGDPIEFHALSDAMAQFTDKKQFCALGAVKANIGHTIAAAGIAGIIKLLLCLKHRTLPPLAGFEKANPHIAPDKSPFFIPVAAQPWTAPEKGPRRAAVSSFGFSGTNAHVVLEEAPAIAPKKIHRKWPYYLLTFSAKTPGSLHQTLHALHTWLCDQKEVDMESLEYTLNTGRTHFDHRAALVVQNKGELLLELKRLLHNGELSSGLKTPGNAASVPAVSLEHLESRSPAEDTFRLALEDMAEKYRNGGKTDWQEFYSHRRAGKIPLPGYAFERQSYWFRKTPSPSGSEKQSEEKTAVEPTTVAAQDKTDTLAPFSVPLELSPDDPMMADHIVQSKRVLPGVACLELVRRATEQATGLQVTGFSRVIFEYGVIAGTGPVTLTVEGRPEGDHLAFRLVHREKEETVCASGEMVLDTSRPGDSPPPISAMTLKFPYPNTLDGSSFYAFCHANAIPYGKSYQVIRHIGWHDEEMVSRLVLPGGAPAQGVVLHPALLDAALHGILARVRQDTRLSAHMPWIPFTIGRVAIYRRTLPAECTAHIRIKDIRPNGDRPVIKYEVTLADAQGNRLADITDVLLIPAKFGATETLPISANTDAVGRSDETTPAFRFTTEWQAAPITGQQTRHGIVGLINASDDQWRLMNEGLAINANLSRIEPIQLAIQPDYTKMRDHFHFISHVLSMGADRKDLPLTLIDFTETSFIRNPHSNPALRWFHLARSLKAMTRQFGTGQSGAGQFSGITIIFAYRRKDDGSTLEAAAMAGFFKSLQREMTGLTIKLIGLHEYGSAQLTVQKILDELQAAPALSLEEIRYDKVERLVKTVTEITPPAEAATLLRRNGVYLITGGTGGIGRHISRFLAKNYGAYLILTGRSAPSEKTESLIQAIQQAGGSGQYVRCDITSRDQVMALMAHIKTGITKLDGIIHCAGTVQDGLIQTKTIEEFNSVLAPKITGLRLLDEITRNEPLDFIALFSSVASLTGNLGQSDYAYANAWLNEFAQWRNRRVAEGQRHGRTVSIIWPFWRDGGMAITAETEAWLEDQWGMTPISTAEGIAAFSAALSGRDEITGYFKGDKARFLRATAGPAAKIITKTVIKESPATTAMAQATPESATQSTRLRNSVSTVAHPSNQEAAAGSSTPEQSLLPVLTEAVAEELKLSPSQIDPQTDIARYGMDSIRLVSLARKLKDKLKRDIEISLLVDYPTLAALSAHLAKNGNGGQNSASQAAHLVARSINSAPVSEKPETAARAQKRSSSPAAVSAQERPSPPGLAATEQAVMQIFAAELKVPLTLLDVTKDTSHFGLDSIRMVSVLRQLERHFKLELDAAAMMDHPTIRQLSHYILNKQGL